MRTPIRQDDKVSVSIGIGPLFPAQKAALGYLDCLQETIKRGDMKDLPKGSAQFKIVPVIGARYNEAGAGTWEISLAWADGDAVAAIYAEAVELAVAWIWEEAPC